MFQPSDLPPTALKCSNVPNFHNPIRIPTELLQRNQVYTLCATHFPELTDLARLYPRARNITMEVNQRDGRLDFAFRPRPGVCVDFAYGVYLAGTCNHW